MADYSQFDNYSDDEIQSLPLDQYQIDSIMSHRHPDQLPGGTSTDVSTMSGVTGANKKEPGVDWSELYNKEPGDLVKPISQNQVSSGGQIGDAGADQAQIQPVSDQSQLAATGYGQNQNTQDQTYNQSINAINSAYNEEGQARQNEAGGINGAVKEYQDASSKMVGALAEHQDKLNKLAADQQNQHAINQKYAEDGLNQLKQASDEVTNAKVDPNHYWADKNFFSKGMAAIAVGLGAYSSAMTGSKNYALDILNDAINRDMEAQKANLANKKAGFETKNSIYSQMLSKFRDENIATENTRITMQDQYKNIVQQYAAKSDDANVKMKAAEIVGQINNQQAQTKLQMANFMYNQAALQGVDPQTRKINNLPIEGDQKKIVNAQYNQALDVKKSLDDLDASRPQLKKENVLFEMPGGKGEVTRGAANAKVMSIVSKVYAGPRKDLKPGQAEKEAEPFLFRGSDVFNDKIYSERMKELRQWASKNMETSAMDQYGIQNPMSSGSKLSTLKSRQ